MEILALLADEARASIAIGKLHELRARAIQARSVRSAVLEITPRYGPLAAGARKGAEADGSPNELAHAPSLLRKEAEQTYAKQRS